MKHRLWIPDLTAALLMKDSQFIIERMDGTIDFIDLQRDQIVASTQGHLRRVSDIAITDAGDFVTVSHDHSIKIWNRERFQSEFFVSQDVPQTVFEKSIGMSLVPLSNGQFWMGERKRFEHAGRYYPGNLPTERPRHLVKISRPFYISQFEVTVKQFRKFVEPTGYKTSAERRAIGLNWASPKGGWEKGAQFNWKSPGFEQDETHSVSQIAYDDAVSYCNWLSEKEGKNYRLPTEEEWEFACRVNTNTSWVSGNKSPNVYQSANIADQSIRTHYDSFGVATGWNDGYAFSAPAGAFRPNLSGCYDMYGNLLEWCLDYFSKDYYSRSPVDDPQGPASGEHRSQRGGSFFTHVDNSRSAFRISSSPEESASYDVFRLVLEIDPHGKSAKK